MEQSIGEMLKSLEKDAGIEHDEVRSEREFQLKGPVETTSAQPASTHEQPEDEGFAKCIETKQEQGMSLAEAQAACQAEVNKAPEVAPKKKIISDPTPGWVHKGQQESKDAKSVGYKAKDSSEWIEYAGPFKVALWYGVAADAGMIEYARRTGLWRDAEKDEILDRPELQNRPEGSGEISSMMGPSTVEVPAVQEESLSEGQKAQLAECIQTRAAQVPGEDLNTTKQECLRVVTMTKGDSVQDLEPLKGRYTSMDECLADGNSKEDCEWLLKSRTREVPPHFYKPKRDEWDKPYAAHETGRVLVGTDAEEQERQRLLEELHIPRKGWSIWTLDNLRKQKERREKLKTWRGRTIKRG